MVFWKICWCLACVEGFTLQNKQLNLRWFIAYKIIRRAYMYLLLGMYTVSFRNCIEFYPKPYSQIYIILFCTLLTLENVNVLYGFWHKNGMIPHYLGRYAQPMSTLSLVDIILLLWFSFYHMDEALIWLWLLWEEPFFSWAKREMAIYWYFMKKFTNATVFHACLFFA